MANQLTLEYVPTQWVDGTAPAINALHLNHIEQGLMEVTDGLIVIESYDMQDILDRLTALEGRCTTLEGRCTTLEGEMTAVEARCTTLEGEVNTLQTEMTAVEGRCTTLEGEVNTLQGEVNTLQLAPPAHTHPIGEVVDLQTQLNRKPNGTWVRSGTTLTIDIEGS